MRRLCHWLSLLLCTCASLAQAEQLLVVAPSVERADQTASEAGYRAFHHIISREAGLDSRLEFLPVPEMRALLARREAQMQIGGACGVERHVPVIYSIPFTRIERHLVTADSTPVLTTLKDLHLLHLGLIKGYFYQLPDSQGLKGLGVELLYSKDLKTSFQLLLAGRADAILANGQVVASIAKTMGVAQRVNVDMAAPFSVTHLCYVFPDTPESQALEDRMSQAIMRLYQSDRLQQVLVPPYQVPQAKYLK
jgi:ABC-type amino acid transport substrate-binding protein